MASINKKYRNRSRKFNKYIKQQIRIEGQSGTTDQNKAQRDKEMENIKQRLKYIVDKVKISTHI